MRGCYETALKTDKTLAGTMKLEFVIEADGSLSKNGIGSDSTIKDQKLGKCLSDMLAGVSFPAFGGEKVTVTYPLVFSP